MSTASDLKKLERKTYLSYHQDGILDLVIGAVVLCLGLKEVIDSSIWNFLALLVIIAYVPLKRKITYPRLGYAKFNVKRGGINLISAGAILLGFLLLVVTGILILQRNGGLTSSNVFQWIRENPLILYGLVGFIGFGLAGLAIGLRRMIVYALLCLVITVSGHFLGMHISIPILVLGSIILIAGAFLLIGFLKKYPINKEEDNDLQ